MDSKILDPKKLYDDLCKESDQTGSESVITFDVTHRSDAGQEKYKEIYEPSSDLDEDFD